MGNIDSSETTLDRARQELSALKTKRSQDFDRFIAPTDRQIAALEEVIKILDPVYAPPLIDISAHFPSLLGSFGVPMGQSKTYAIGELMQGIGVELGLTESVRQVLRSHPGVMLTPTQVRDKLVENKTILPINPLVAIHTALTRIADSSGPQFRSGDDINRGKWYMFDPSIPPAPRRSRFATRGALAQAALKRAQEAKK